MTKSRVCVHCSENEDIVCTYNDDFRGQLYLLLEFKGRGREEGRDLLGLDLRRFEGGNRSTTLEFSMSRSKGMKTFWSGSKYEGEIMNGKRHGSGVKSWPNGDKYDGGRKGCL